MSNRSIPRLLQQQPERRVNRQQQQSSGSSEYQPRRAQQMGEKSYADAAEEESPWQTSASDHKFHA